jgi:hypothetical protein
MQPAVNRIIAWLRKLVGQEAAFCASDLFSEAKSASSPHKTCASS